MGRERAEGTRPRSLVPSASICRLHLISCQSGVPVRGTNPGVFGSPSLCLTSGDQRPLSAQPPPPAALNLRAWTPGLEVPPAPPSPSVVLQPRVEGGLQPYPVASFSVSLRGGAGGTCLGWNPGSFLGSGRYGRTPPRLWVPVSPSVTGRLDSAMSSPSA